MRCLVCDKFFISKVDSQKYCSRECRNYAHYETQKRKKARLEKDIKKSPDVMQGVQ